MPRQGLGRRQSDPASAGTPAGRADSAQHGQGRRNLRRVPPATESVAHWNTPIVADDAVSERRNSSTAAVPHRLDQDRSTLRDLGEDLERAHTQRLPGARILMALPPSIEDRDKLYRANLGPALYISEARDGRSILGVVQRREDVNFRFAVPFRAESSSPYLAATVDDLRCAIWYNPSSDTCEFTCNSHGVVLIDESSGTGDKIEKGWAQGIEPGLWRVCVHEGSSQARLRPVIEFLLLKRTLEAASTPAQRELGHPISEARDDSDKDFATGKRQEAITEFVLEPLELNNSQARLAAVPEQQQSAQNQAGNSSPRRRTPDDATRKEAFACLKDKQTADITTGRWIKPNTAAQRRWYRQQQHHRRVTRLKHSRRNRSPSVFACRYGEIINNTVLDKVLNTVPTTSTCDSIARSWLQAIHVLDRLKHPNIAQIQVLDGRGFAVYLEQLPGSLASRDDGEHRFSRHDAAAILRDAASALAHLDKNNICHNDIQPSTIAYSPERGAVVFDLGVATSGPVTAQYPGGTPWYVAPEAVDRGVRTPSSDVWALGVTMLFVLRRIWLPETCARPFDFTRVQEPNSPDRVAMESWLAEVDHHREELDMEDLVEKLVSDMLDEDPDERITAREIVAMLPPAERGGMAV